VSLPPLAEQALTYKRLHEWGYRWADPPLIRNLTPRQRQLVALAAHAESYIEQAAQDRRQHGRPDHFADGAAVRESRREAFGE